jgi:hypothetical protein
VMQKGCIGLTVKDRAYEGLGVLVDLLLRAVGAENLVKLVQLACAAARIVDGQLALLADLTAACQHRHNPKSMPRSSNGACTYWWLLQDMCSWKRQCSGVNMADPDPMRNGAASCAGSCQDSAIVNRQVTIMLVLR